MAAREELPADLLAQRLGRDLLDHAAFQRAQLERPVAHPDEARDRGAEMLHQAADFAVDPDWYVIPRDDSAEPPEEDPAT